MNGGKQSVTITTDIFSTSKYVKLNTAVPKMNSRPCKQNISFCVKRALTPKLKAETKSTSKSEMRDSRITARHATARHADAMLIRFQEHATREKKGPQFAVGEDTVALT